MFLGIGSVVGPPMPTFVDAGAGTAGSGGGTISPAYPAAIVAGQFLVLHLYLGDAVAPAAATPAGWTSAGDLPSGATTYKQWLFWKVATGSESGTEAVTITASITQAARIYRFSSGTGLEAITSTQRSSGGVPSYLSEDFATLGANRCAIQLFGGVANTTVANMTGESGGDYTKAVGEFAAAQPVTIALQSAAMPVAQAIFGGTALLGISATNRCTAGAAIIP